MNTKKDAALETLVFESDSPFLFHVNCNQEDYPNHWHNAIEIIMPIDNSYSVEVNNQSFLLNEYDIIVVPSGALHSTRAPQASGQRIIMQFDLWTLNTIRGFMNVAYVYTKCLVITPNKMPELHDHIKKRLLDMLDEDQHKRLYYEVTIVNKIIDITVQLTRWLHLNDSSNYENLIRRREHVAKMNECIDYITSHFKDNLSLDTVAYAAGFSKFHFARWFKHVNGISFTDYLTKMRIEHAESMLLGSSTPVTSIALESGFQSTVTFNRIFKELKKCTPSEYRKNHFLKVSPSQNDVSKNSKVNKEGQIVDTKKQMTMKIIPALCNSIIEPLPGTSRVNNDNTFTNPFLWADVPDPDVIRVGDIYYMVSTTMYFSPHCPIMKSYDLVNWEIVNYVCDILDDSDAFTLRNGEDAYGKGTWAACIRYHKGIFYVTSASFNTGKTYIFTTRDIENGPWQRNTLDLVHHDQSLLFDDDGRVYMASGAGLIHMLELTGDASAVKPDGLDCHVIDSMDISGKDGLPAEGAHFYKINGKYYIFLITWPQTGTNRRIQLCYRADRIEGPYEGRIVLDDTLGFKNMGVAQGGIVDTPDGEWYAMLFQDHGAVGRIPVLVPVTWEDGWPIFGIDNRVPQQMRLIKAGQDKKGIVVSDEFNQYSLALPWQWNHNPDHNLWTLTERPGYLRLKAGYLNDGLLSSRNTLTQRSFGPVCMGTVAIDTSGMKDGDTAGLAALQDIYGYVGVKVTEGVKYIVMVNAAMGQPQEMESVPFSGDEVYLSLEFDFNNANDKARFFYSEDEIHWHTIGDVLPMRYKLTHFTGYRFALFYFATQHIGGYADFDYLRISGQTMSHNENLAILNASFEKDVEVLGVPDTAVDLVIQMDSLPDGLYKGMYMSMTIPEPLTVADVAFISENIAGDVAYSLTDHRLYLSVTGEAVSFTNKTSDLFARLHGRIQDFVPEDITLTLRPDYIFIDGGNVVYGTHEMCAQINVKALKTNAKAKRPGLANPLISHKFGADPWAMEYDGRVYMYLTSDRYEYNNHGRIIDNTYAQINTITVLSSADMINWTDHGEINVAGSNGAAKWAVHSWAPAVAYKSFDGKDRFFLYFANDASNIGVLTADSPVGPWTDPLGAPLIHRGIPGVKNVTWCFDPAVLVDNDGTGYLYFGGGLPSASQQDTLHPCTARVIRLTDDMVHTEGEAAVIDAPALFEDSGINIINGRYYYSYCSNFEGDHPKPYPPHGEIAYMTSDSPMGPFTYAGTLLKNPGHFFQVGGNNHHCIFSFKEEWYIAYHTQTLGQDLGMSKGYRSPHINKLDLNMDHSIKQVAADRKGVIQPVALNPYIRTEAETIAWCAGISTAGSQDSGGMYVTDIHTGDWLAVAHAAFGESGAVRFTARVASLTGGEIEIRLDSPQGRVVGMLGVRATGGEDCWGICSCEVERITGDHHVFFVFSGDSERNLMNFDYWYFEKEPRPNEKSML